MALTWNQERFNHTRVSSHLQSGRLPVWPTFTWLVKFSRWIVFTAIFKIAKVNHQTDIYKTNQPINQPTRQADQNKHKKIMLYPQNHFTFRFRSCLKWRWVVWCRVVRCKATFKLWKGCLLNRLSGFFFLHTIKLILTLILKILPVSFHCDLLQKFCQMAVTYPIVLT